MPISDLPVCRLAFEGSQTVHNIQAAHDRISASIAEHQTVEIHCEGITELDLGFIQLLLAAKRSADERGTSLRLASGATGKLRAALERAGFLSAGADDSDRSSAFWLQGSNA